MLFRNDDKREAGGDGNVRVLPLLPLRDIIIFPHMVVPLFVGREKSIRALEEAMRKEKDLLLAAQRKAKTNDPRPDDIYQVGTLGVIVQLIRLPDGTVKVLVEGKRRARIKRFLDRADMFMVEAEEVPEAEEAGKEIDALVRAVNSAFDSYVKLNKRIPPEMLTSVASIDEPGRLADTIAAHLSLKLEEKQALLDMESPASRLGRLLELMHGEVEVLQVEKKIRQRVKKQMERTQKEYYLNEQMQAIQKELGERDEFKNELQELEDKIKSKDLSEEAQIKCDREVKKLKMMQPMSAEATVVRNYIDWIIGIPWNEKSEVQIDLDSAEKILDADHFGLDKPKERILEYLAVLALVDKMRGPILCFVGPPGVGKTSLARSIAKATGREFVRQSLGGVRDEAEIRGHRRTYIGALPGKVVQSMRKAGASNPVMLLDEVDKMSMDFRGDPSSALLEVLDPEQNSTFNDHYLDLDYDLSDVMFICTANELHGIPAPLRDRMEIIRIAGYTEDEKLQIAVRYLVPKQREANGIQDVPFSLGEPALRSIIRHYTLEAGVRNLEREIATVCRKVARDVVQKGDKTRKTSITTRNIGNYLGVQKFRYGKAEEKDQIGLCTGLAVTSFGGEILQTEVGVMDGKGKLTITGKVGDVMQESAHAAMTYVRTRSHEVGLDPEFYSKQDIHIHVPEGATPKDGPSAGITIATALFSALTGVPVRSTVAMTGEITLRGRVLPIGGLKEKLLAAHRGKIEHAIIPKENEKDLKDVPQKILQNLEVTPVEHMDEVLRIALAIEDFDPFWEKRRAERKAQVDAEREAAERFRSGGPGAPAPH